MSAKRYKFAFGPGRSAGKCRKRNEAVEQVLKKRKNRNQVYDEKKCEDPPVRTISVRLYFPMSTDETGHLRSESLPGILSVNVNNASSASTELT